MVACLWLLVNAVPLIIECVLGLVCTVSTEIGIHSFRTPYQTLSRSPLAAAFGYFMAGAICGGLSLLVVPELLINDPAVRRANLIFAPGVAGFIMMGVGAFRRRRGEDPLRLDTFIYGVLFALAFASARLILGR